MAGSSEVVGSSSPQFIYAGGAEVFFLLPISMQVFLETSAGCGTLKHV